MAKVTRTKTSKVLHNSNGFKETEVGYIPAEWEAAQLEDIAVDFFSGGTPSTKRLEYWQGEVSWTTSAYIGEDLYLRQGAKKISRLGLGNSSSNLVPKDNLLIGTRVGVGKVAINAIDIAISQDLTALILDREKASPEFVAYAIRADTVQRLFQSAMRGTTIKGIARDDLKKIPLPLPSLSEQRAIAHVLSTIQRAIAAQDAVIAAAREVKGSLMHRLFTYGPYAEPSPTKETEIGEVPEHWKIVQLGHLARIGNGSTPKRDNPSFWENGDIPWLTSTKVHESVITHADEFVTATAKAECHLPLVRKGSLVVAITGQGKTLGNAALVTIDTCINQHLAYIEFENNNVLPEFMLLFLQGQYQHLRQIGQSGGSTKGALTCSFLKGYLVPIPPIDEQHQIAVTLGILGQKLQVEDQRKTALQALFKSMLHQLMTGKVRVAQHGL